MEHPVPIFIENNNTTVNILDNYTSATVTSKMITPLESQPNNSSANNNYYTIVLVGLGLLIYLILYIRRKRNKKKYMEKHEEEYLNYYHSILPQSQIYRGASDTYTQANLTTLAESFHKEKNDGHEGISGIAGLARLMQAHCKPLDTEETKQTVCLTDVCSEIPADIHVYENQVTDEILTDNTEQLPNNEEIKSSKSLNKPSVSPNMSECYRDTASLDGPESEQSSNAEKYIITKLDANPPHIIGVNDSSKAKTEQSSNDERKIANNLDFLPSDTPALRDSSKSNTEQSSVDERNIPEKLDILSYTAGLTDSLNAKATESSNDGRKNSQKLDFLSPDTTGLTDSLKSKPDCKNTYRKPKSHIFASLLENLRGIEVFTVSENPRNNHVSMEEIVTDLDDKNDAVKPSVVETPTETYMYTDVPKFVKWSSKDRNDNFIPSFNLVDCNTNKHYTNNASDVVIFHDDYLTGTWI